MKVGEETKTGMLGYKYNFVDDALDNGKHNPDNKCFCRHGRCLPEGLIDVTDCYYGRLAGISLIFQLFHNNI